MSKSYINKIYASIFLISLLLSTGCSTVDSKEALIEKANSGDIQSMVKLNKVYKFGATKEDLKQYKIWSSNVDESTNPKDILALTKMFYDSKLAFTDGRKMYEDLLEIANMPQNKKATLTLLNFYTKYYHDYDVGHKIRKLESSFIQTATEQDLLDLYNLYSNTNVSNGGNENRNRIKAVMVKKGYMEDRVTELELFKRILDRKEPISDSIMLLSNILKSNDLEKIYETALFLGHRDRISLRQEVNILIHEQAEAFMEKVLTLKPNDEIETNVMLYLSYFYTRYNKNDLTKQKHVLTNTDKMGKTQRYKILVAMYDIDKAKYAKNIEYIDKELKTLRTEAYINIAKIYHYGNDQEPIDIEQAKIWYKKADTKEAKDQLIKLNKT